MLRIYLTTALTLFLSLSLLGQEATQQGRFMLGGTLTFNRASSEIQVVQNGSEETTNGPTTLNFNASPALTYFLADNLALGFSAFSNLQITDIDDTRTTDSDLLVGPMARYYLPFDGNKAVMLHASSGFGTSNDDLVIDGNEVEATNNLTRISVGPGVTLFSNQRVGIEVLALYTYIRNNSILEGDVTNSETTTFTNEFDVRLGIQFYLGK